MVLPKNIFELDPNQWQISFIKLPKVEDWIT